LSTRGQNLPSLIRERSIGSVRDMRTGSCGCGGFDLERGGEGGGLERGGGRDRMMMMTPQMRSMRLIGDGNPRYQW
jgi:hypothetical protein